MVIPLKSASAADRTEITAGLQRLGAGTLLFLRHVEEIAWSVKGGPSSRYLLGCPEELAHVEERRGKSVFAGEYTWTHYGAYRTRVDAAFVRMLNTTSRVPDPGGNLQRPELASSVEVRRTP